ncbi:hypothetical protein [Catenulispora sp. GAS73]|uniref:hypothetical protein n=1 Tax=Catenulispora sp. GAS73 TaxID=3156269 RepID=UPI003515AD45
MSSAHLTSISSSEVSSLELGFTVEHGRTVSYTFSVDELNDAGYGSWWLVRGSEEFYEVCHPSVAESSYAMRAAAAYSSLFGEAWRPVELRVVGELHHRMVLRHAATGSEAVVDVVLPKHGEAAGGERVTVARRSPGRDEALDQGPAPELDQALLNEVARVVRLFDVQAAEPLEFAA